MSIKILIIAILNAMICWSVLAEEESPWSGSGEISFEGRVFKDDNNDNTEDRGLALFSRLESKYEKGDFSFFLRAFARVDRYDRGRDVFAPEDSYISYNFESATLSAGYQIFNWSATEVFHPADIINSRNFDSNIENQEKLGELTLSLKFDFFEGDVTFFYFPKYEKPIPPGRRSRLGIDLGFDIADPSFVENDNFVSTDSYGNQYGVRLAQSIGDVDISMHYLRFMDRLQPLYFFDGQTIKPHLFMMDQIGGTLSYVFGEGVIGKLEFAHKDFISSDSITNILLQGSRSPVDHWQVVWGAEWGWGNSNGTDTTLYLEYQRFIESENITNERLDELGIFQNDLFFGIRHAFNDVNGKELVASIIKDMDRDSEILFQLTYSQRLNELWKIKAGLRYIDAPVKDSVPVGLEVLHEDHQLSLAFSRYF